MVSIPVKREGYNFIVPIAFGARGNSGEYAQVIDIAGCPRYHQLSIIHD
jgi:hypothetical protein